LSGHSKARLAQSADDRQRRGHGGWDLSFVELVDNHDDRVACRLFPLDKSANASGIRRTLNNTAPEVDAPSPSGIAPLLRKFMSDYAADGLPPPYIVKDDQQEQQQEAHDDEA
jgi:hypothetical protein